MHAAAAAAAKDGADPPPCQSEESKVSLKAALTLAESAVCKLPAVPCQDLLEMAVQLQIYLGLPATTLPTVLPAQRTVAQV
jgi:hypothetical protein